MLDFTLDHTLSNHAAFKWSQADENGRWTTLPEWNGLNTDKWSDGMTGWQNDTHVTICFA